MLLRHFLWEAASQFLRAAASMYVQTQRPLFVCETAILQVMEWEMWPANQARQIWTGLLPACHFPKVPNLESLSETIFSWQIHVEFLRKMCIESTLGTAFFLVHRFALNRFKQFSMENPESSSHVSICRLVQVAVLVWWQRFGTHWKDDRGPEIFSSYYRQACDIKFPHLDILAATAGKSCKKHSFAGVDIAHSCSTLHAKFDSWSG